MGRNSWLNRVNYSETVSYERETGGDANRMRWGERETGWMMEGAREEWRQRVNGRDRVRAGRLGWVIQAGLKAELLKFGLIPQNLCFVPVFLRRACFSVWTGGEIQARGKTSETPEISIAEHQWRPAVQLPKSSSYLCHLLPLCDWICPSLHIPLPSSSEPTIRLSLKHAAAMQLVVFWRRTGLHFLIDSRKKPRRESVKNSGEAKSTSLTRIKKKKKMQRARSTVSIIHFFDLSPFIFILFKTHFCCGYLAFYHISSFMVNRQSAPWTSTAFVSRYDEL